MTTPIKSPTKFVGLHNHSTFSLADGIGQPQEHIDFAISNGSDALALTDHGNCNGISFQQNKLKELAKAGVKFKGIPGQEFYFVDSLSEWRKQKQYRDEQAEEVRHQKKLEAAAAKKKKTSKKEAVLDEELALFNFGNELASTEEELEQLNGKVALGEDGEVVNPTGMGLSDESVSVAENEEESKSQRWNDPVKQRNHLVLLPKNSEGLKAIFRLTSEAYANGFYRFPRIDLELLKKYSRGNILAISACIAGVPAKCVANSLPPEGNVIDYGPGSVHDFEKAQRELKKYIELFQDALGEENYFLEIQHNRIPFQSLTNIHILEASKRTGVKVVSTADAHYSNPAHWKEREIYKAMSWASKGLVDVNALPQKIEDLKCELYPKNAKQMWDSYLQYSKPYEEFYKPFEQQVADSIELTHDIAWKMIGEVTLDKKIKLPVLDKLVEKPRLDELYARLGVNADESDICQRLLTKDAIEGLKWRGKDKDQRYIDRLKQELSDVKHLKFAKYFLTEKKIIDVTKDKLLIGNGRGCFVPGTRVKMANGVFTPIEKVKVGESIIDAYGKEQTVLNCLEYNCSEEILELEFENGKTVRCTKDHEFLTGNRGWVKAEDLTEEDDIKSI
jgi:DNA polymerase III alpha subunit